MTYLAVTRTQWFMKNLNYLFNHKCQRSSFKYVFKFLFVFQDCFYFHLSRCVAWMCISCVYVIVCMCASTYIHVYHDTMLKCDVSGMIFL